MRGNNRHNDALREVKITKNYTKHAAGSVLIETGDTKVICTASFEDKVPHFKKDSKEGWITAEYSMLPSATIMRKSRDISRLKLDGRSGEIQRLIGRALRSVVDFKKMGEITITIDCDVIQADGGTRTASITGGFVALYLAFLKLMNENVIKEMPIKSFVAATSCGITNSGCLLDLDYLEDSCAIVDSNFVLNEDLDIIEIQGTGEKRPFTEGEFNEMLSLAKKGVAELISVQKEILGVK